MEVLTFTIKVELPTDEFKEQFNFKSSDDVIRAQEIVWKALENYFLCVKDVELTEISCKL